MHALRKQGLAVQHIDHTSYGSTRWLYEVTAFTQESENWLQHHLHTTVCAQAPHVHDNHTSMKCVWLDFGCVIQGSQTCCARATAVEEPTHGFHDNKVQI